MNRAGTTKPCDEFRRALPDLKRNLYGTERAAEVLLYCGDRKSALKAAVGYDLQPLWPVAMDPEILARIRISSAGYAQAEALLRERSSYWLYVALAEQGRREHVLERLAAKKGWAHILLLRHKGRWTEARDAAAELCAALRRWRPSTPSALARIFETCMLSEGANGLARDSLFQPAKRGLPGLRGELAQFTKREAPDLEAGLTSLFSE